MLKEEYIGRLDALKQIKKICEDNKFSNEENDLYTLRSLERGVTSIIEKIEKLKKYEKFSTDCDFDCKLIFEYGGDCMVCKRDYITNVGEICEEELFEISFPTGAYIFGNKYDKELFDEFFEELKNGTNYKYIDELNHSLYYSFENDKAYKAYDYYKELMKEYHKKYKDRKKEQDIKELKIKLEELERE